MYKVFEKRLYIIINYEQLVLSTLLLQDTHLVLISLRLFVLQTNCNNQIKSKAIYFDIHAVRGHYFLSSHRRNEYDFFGNYLKNENIFSTEK